MRLALFMLLLTGCATDYWFRDMPGYRVERIIVEQRPDLAAVCGLPKEWNGKGCVIRLRDGALGQTARVYIKPGLSDEEWSCVLRHEARHIGGENHDRREIYREDCGCLIDMAAVGA